MKFYGSQVYLSSKDKETLFYLAEESALPSVQKQRLKSKLAGEYLNDKTYELGMAAQKKNRNRWELVGR